MPRGAAGNKINYSYKAEVTPGTDPGGVTANMPVVSDPTKWSWDPGRQPLKLAVGSNFSDWTTVEYEAKGTGSVQFPLSPTVGQDYMTLNGFAGSGAITAPSFHTVHVNRVNGVSAYSGCLAKTLKITAKSTTPVLVDATFDFMTKEVISGATSPPSLPSPEKPFTWAMITPQTLLGGAGQVNISNIEVMVNFNQFAWYGSWGQNGPNDLIEADIEVTFSFTKLFLDNAERALFLATCFVPGTVIFPFVSTCGGSHSCTLTLHNAVYKLVEWENPMKGAIVEKFTGYLEQPGTSSLSYVIT